MDVWVTQEQEGLAGERALRNLLLLCNPDTQSSVWATPPHSHSESDYKTKKNWLTDSSGSTWTAESSGSSSGYLEKTTQDSFKYSWDWTQTDSNYTKTDVGYSGQGSYDHTKDTWESGYSGKSSSDGSSTLTMSSGGSQAHDWKYTGDSSEAWTETWTNGSTSGSTSGSGGGSSSTSSGSCSSSWGSSGSSFNSWSGSWSYSTPANVFLSGSGSGTSSSSGGASTYTTQSTASNSTGGNTSGGTGGAGSYATPMSEPAGTPGNAATDGVVASASSDLEFCKVMDVCYETPPSGHSKWLPMLARECEL